MIKKITQKILLLAICCAAQAQAQITVNPTEDSYIREKDKETHQQWRKGEQPFPAKPRDMWQVGVGVGSFLVSGDVKSQFGWGTGLHFRKSLGYILSLKMEYMYGQAKGLNYQATSNGAYPSVAPFPITPDGERLIAAGLYDLNEPFYANYKMNYHAASLQAVVNINNIRFHKPSNKWSLNWILGVGANAYNTRYDALDKNGNAYDFGGVSNNLNPSVLADRRTIRDNAKGILDGEYETQAQQNDRNLVRFGSDKHYSLTPFVNTGLSLEFLLTPRLSIALEHQVFFTADDYLDGFSRKINGSLTSNSDIPHYTSVRLGFHIGKKSKKIQPLWFINPLIFPNQDIADLKKKLDDDWFKDDDDDGVPNKLDKEKGTEPLAVVDSKGRTKDSDKDGVPDHKDDEPFSPPGYKVNEQGVAQVPKPIYPDQVKVDGNKLIIGNETYEPVMDGSGKGGNLKDWYLPMVHFDLDKYTLRPEAYSQLQHVAEVMKKYPELKIVAYGHTDSRAADDYNDMLSYNRVMSAIDFLVQQHSIDKNRFIVQYNGKRKQIIGNARREEEHFMNRRVEFFVATGKDLPQVRPNAPKEKRGWKY